MPAIDLSPLTIVKIVRKAIELFPVPVLDDADGVYEWLLKVMDLVKTVASLTETTTDDKLVDALNELAGNKQVVVAIVKLIQRIVATMGTDEHVDDQSIFGFAAEQAAVSGIDPLIIQLIIQVAVAIFKLLTA